MTWRCGGGSLLVTDGVEDVTGEWVATSSILASSPASFSGSEEVSTSLSRARRYAVRELSCSAVGFESVRMEFIDDEMRCIRRLRELL